MCTEWLADLTLYKLLTDWGSLIGGGFALIAGAIAYKGAMRAARTQVSAIFSDIERPAIFVEAERARWHTGHIPNIPFIQYSIRNHGLTAAIIKSRKISAVVVETIPKIVPCETEKEAFDWTSVVANGGLTNLQLETVVRNDDADRLQFVRRTRRLSGVIVNEDPFGKRKFTTRFGWIFEPSDPTISHSNEHFIACDKPGMIM